MTTSDPGGRPRFAVLISGRGSNLAAILASRASLAADLVGVIASRADAAGLRHAEEAGVATAVIAADRHVDRDALDVALVRQLEAWSVDWVVLAGYMRILGGRVLERFSGRVVNIHPSLLPAFPGLRPHEQALEAGVAVSGCTVHLVTPGAVDGGPILAQVEVPVLPGDSAATLAARVLEVEHRLYPATLARLFRGEVSGQGGDSISSPAR